MRTSSWLCWIPKAKDCSKRRQSGTAGRTDDRSQSHKKTSEHRKEDMQALQSQGEGATSNTGVAWYERMLKRHTEPTSRRQEVANISQSKVSESQQRKHRASTTEKGVVGSSSASHKRDPVSPSKGPLIKAVPGTRAQARQESFRVETSWLAVADVSFADMLQVVDVAASRQGQQSRPCESASTECTLVFPKLKGRVSDSGCRSAVSKKTAGMPLHSPRPPSNLGAHMQGDGRSRRAEASQSAARSSAAAYSPRPRPCKAEAHRARSDASRPARPQRLASGSADKHQLLIQKAALARLPNYAEHPSSQPAAAYA
ncbi:g10494 [Coccomyxa viridis]|uniref:G10494 protein n=1 Tax=Coccomyxa viridis TaxID=1274662 RepID=A0ABP1G5T9_9CHLO